MATLNLALDTRRVKQDDTFPLALGLLEISAEALGHEYGNSVTGIYLEQFDIEVVDQMNQNLISAVVKYL